jgi:hypothetical protein
MNSLIRCPNCGRNGVLRVAVGYSVCTRCSFDSRGAEHNDGVPVPSDAETIAALREALAQAEARATTAETRAESYERREAEDVRGLYLLADVIAKDPELLRHVERKDDSVSGAIRAMAALKGERDEARARADLLANAPSFAAVDAGRTAQLEAERDRVILQRDEAEARESVERRRAERAERALAGVVADLEARAAVAWAAADRWLVENPDRAGRHQSAGIVLQTAARDYRNGTPGQALTHLLTAARAEGEVTGREKERRDVIAFVRCLSMSVEPQDVADSIDRGEHVAGDTNDTETQS